MQKDTVSDFNSHVLHLCRHVQATCTSQGARTCTQDTDKVTPDLTHGVSMLQMTKWHQTRHTVPACKVSQYNSRRHSLLNVCWFWAVLLSPQYGYGSLHCTLTVILLKMQPMGFRRVGSHQRLWCLWQPQQSTHRLLEVDRKNWGQTETEKAVSSSSKRVHHHTSKAQHWRKN